MASLWRRDVCFRPFPSVDLLLFLDYPGECSMVLSAIREVNNMQ